MIKFQQGEQNNIRIVGGKVVIEFIGLGDKIPGLSDPDVVMPEINGSSNLDSGIKPGSFQ